MKTKTTQIQIKNLKHDSEIIEMRPINDVFVSRYRQAMRAGDRFPPLIIEEGTNIIVSGNTRATAYRKEYGEDHAVPCIVRKFSDRAEVISEAVRDNAKHGNPLDGFQRKRFAAKLLNLGQSPEQIASLFGVAVKRIEEWAGEVVVVRGMGPQPVKRGLGHMAGLTISKKEYQAHVAEDRGVPACAQARQLARWIRQGWVDMNDPKTVDAMQSLVSAIQEWLNADNISK